MKADLIIFDKDGTLIDFDAFWVSVSVKAIEYVLREVGREDIPVEDILLAIGVKNGVTDIDGKLCGGTYLEIAELIWGVIAAHGCDEPRDKVVKLAIDGYNICADEGKVVPTSDGLVDYLKALKERGIKLALVTTDNAYITELCLKTLGAYELFDKIYPDDGEHPTKPDPYYADRLMSEFGVKKENVIMVGDTMTDVRFAKNAGIMAVCVARNEKLTARLAPYADRVIEKIPDLDGVIG